VWICLAGMQSGGSELIGLIVAVSFAAGLNVYATVATLGLLAYAGLLDPANRPKIVPLCGRAGRFQVAVRGVAR
jgi:hypothetical protein